MRLHCTASLAVAAPLKLISHKLCPYVQRAVIALTEKGVSFERIDIDLANKPDWFLRISPLGKTPVLVVGEHAIFESAVILEYLEETQTRPLHPADPITRAEHRAWIEFGSAVLNDIAGFYTASDEAALKARAAIAAGIDRPAHQGHRDRRERIASGLHQGNRRQHRHRWLAHRDDMHVAAQHVQHLYDIVDIVVEIEAAFGKRDHPRVRPVGDVDLMCRQESLDGTAEQRRVVP